MDNSCTSSSNLTNIENFDGINFTHWQTNTQLVIMHYKVWRLVKGNEPKPESIETSPQVIAWNDKNYHALAIVGLGLGDNYIHHLKPQIKYGKNKSLNLTWT